MILFVGDKPSPKMKPEAKPFEGAACESRLKEWIYYLCDYTEFQSVMYKNDLPWRIMNSDNDEILRNALIWAAWNQSKVVTLGQEAYKKVIKLKYDIFALPHPSGRNRQINDKEFINKKLKECIEWLNSNSTS